LLSFLSAVGETDLLTCVSFFFSFFFLHVGFGVFLLMVERRTRMEFAYLFYFIVFFVADSLVYFILFFFVFFYKTPI